MLMLELGSSLAAALVWVLVTLALLVGEVELGPEVELSLSLASLFLASDFFTVFLSFLVAAGAAPVTSASNSSLSSDSGDWPLVSLEYSLMRVSKIID